MLSWDASGQETRQGSQLLSVGLEGDLASVPAQPIPQLLGQGVLWLPFTHRAGVTPVNDGTAAG